MLSMSAHAIAQLLREERMLAVNTATQIQGHQSNLRAADGNNRLLVAPAANGNERIVVVGGGLPLNAPLQFRRGATIRIMLLTSHQKLMVRGDRAVRQRAALFFLVRRELRRAGRQHDGRRDALKVAFAEPGLPVAMYRHSYSK
jgi:hypothetical protein